MLEPTNSYLEQLVLPFSVKSGSMEELAFMLFMVQLALQTLNIAPERVTDLLSHLGFFLQLAHRDLQLLDFDVLPVGSRVALVELIDKFG